MAKCLEEYLNRSLQENICNLQGHGTLRAEIDSRTIANHLPPDLQYTCRFWVYHLKRVRAINDSNSVHIFLRDHFLHWLESMSLLGRISESIKSSSTLQTLVVCISKLIITFLILTSIQSDKRLEIYRFLNDTMRFIQKNISMIDQAPLQLYTSALIFTPKSKYNQE